MQVDTRGDVSEGLQELARRAEGVARNIGSVVIGKPDVIQACVVALLAGGHIIIEDYPGVGKTLLAKALARSVSCRFARIQFTPDLLPSDVTGVSVFNQETRTFEFRPGPIFANIVLADEINRSSPKTQSSLLECMEERQATVDNVTHSIGAPFMVVATQNPIEYEGTYPLPEAQLDRFMMRVSLGYPDTEAEQAVLARHSARRPVRRPRGGAGPAGTARHAARPRRVGWRRPWAATWWTCSTPRAPARTSTWAPARAPVSPWCARAGPWRRCAAGTTWCRRTSRTWPCAC